MALSEKNSNGVQSYTDILSVLENYVKSLKEGNVEQLQKTFHGEAVMYGYWEEHLIEGSIINLYNSVTKYGAAPHITAHIDILHKTEDIALARIEYERNAADKNGVDYHSLIKVNGEWKVISKLFQIPVK
ncbi:AtzH-like domain-containing protein [Chryseobacterium polytrichastri]|uniref:Putative lumazine-binding n=1 Tax=Chryseobacterium polytrichastri TaxID=1302687 RepID=A0A1M6YYG1_9FLAO|nr:AtzH-like domain-containing protein [Chryseobacterium polytrichastri]SHL23122.1 Putative lumazine-binding [Chryseobacterium polytrichastri]